VGVVLEATQGRLHLLKLAALGAAVVLEIALDPGALRFQYRIEALNP